MTKKEFDELYVGENIRVHCKTKSLNDEFLSLIKRFGYTILGNCQCYGDKVFYCISKNRCYGVGFDSKEDCRIIEFKSQKEESMEDLRELLKFGRVVELRDGCMGFLLEDRVIFQNAWVNLKQFDENLEHKRGRDGDIVAIYNSPIIEDIAWSFKSENKDNLNVIWEKEIFRVTEDEKVILRSLSNAFRFIVRNMSGKLFLFELEPHKNYVYNIWTRSKSGFGVGETVDFEIYNHLFDYIKWEDEKPTKISDLLNS